MKNVCVSTIDGYSFFIDEHVEKKGKKLKKDFVVFLNGKSMNGTEISKELKVTRMAVSQSLKRALRKIYNFLKKTNRHYDSFEIAVAMSEMFRVSLDSESEMTKFFNLFPANIKQEIKEHAKNHVNYCSQCPFDKTMCQLF